MRDRIRGGRHPVTTDRRVVELGLQRLARLRSPRRVRRGRGHRRRCRHAVPDPSRISSGTRSAPRATRALRLGVPCCSSATKRSPGEVCAAVEDACGRERLRSWWRMFRSSPRRSAPTARDASMPRILQVVIGAPAAGRAAGRTRRTGPARTRRRRRRSRRLRRVLRLPTVTYKALVRREPAGRVLSRPPRSRRRGAVRRLPPAVLDEHRADVGACAAVPDALPQRRDQHDRRQRRADARARGRGWDSRARRSLLPALRSTSAAPTRRCSTRRSTCSTSQARRAASRTRHPSRDRDDRPGRVGGRARHRPDGAGFYRWHSSLMEPWDGPAALVFTDGVVVGAALDRNGLRPMRYAATDDGLVVCASEAGVVDLAGERVRRGRLGPGQMLVVDPRDGRAARRRDPRRGDRSGRRPAWREDIGARGSPRCRSRSSPWDRTSSSRQQVAARATRART